MCEMESGYHPDPRPTEELIRTALDNYGNCDEFVTIVEMLQYRGTREVLDAAVRLTQSGRPPERVLGAGILAQVGAIEYAFRKESIDVLIPLLEDDDPEVASTAAYALAFRAITSSPEAQYAANAVKPLLAQKDHPSGDVRAGVAYALGFIIWLDLSSETRVLLTEALVQLASDIDEDVRAEAVDALVFIEQDSKEVIDVLLARVHDESAEVRASALMGLAYRKYPGVVDMLIEELSTSEYIYDDALDAASMTEDTRLLPVLLQLKEEGIDSRFLEWAIEDCSGDADGGESV